MTGEESLDFVIDAGPRALTPDVPQHIRLELAKTSVAGPYLDACKLLAQHELEEIHREIEFVSLQNSTIDWMATGTHIPEYRIPVSMWEKMQAIFGEDCWQDKDFVEDTLKHHPGLRVIVKRGIHGQQYVNGKGR